MNASGWYRSRVSILIDRTAAETAEIVRKEIPKISYKICIMSNETFFLDSPKRYDYGKPPVPLPDFPR